MARWNCTGEAAICDSIKIEHTSGLPTFVSVSPIRGSSKCHMGPAIAHAAAVLSVYSIVIGLPKKTGKEKELFFSAKG